MSQAKVDRYKEEKKNRKQTMKKKNASCTCKIPWCSDCGSSCMLDRIFRIFLLSGEETDDKNRTFHSSTE